MQSSKPAVWLPGAVISQYLRFICPEGFESWNPPRAWTLGMVAYWGTFMLSMFWLKLITKHVPEPYLDEIFHIPQAQLYCMGKYDYWDPKLTTPPGLYIFATIFTKLRYGDYDAFGLRLFNATILPVTLLFALSCRHLIGSSKTSAPVTSDTIHTAINVALFPPLFFFSGLFYTDLLSTCVVLVTYRFFLRSQGRVSWVVLPLGLVALSMRQTNIFWVAIFLGGLEIVRPISKKPIIKASDQIVPVNWRERVRFEVDKWSRGNIHDFPLSSAGVHDYVVCALSIVIAALYQPLRTLTRLSPYIALLISFALFVFWNGGVVLGDKSNHVATIHLPQLLYLFAFTAFFSLPLLVSPVLNFLSSLLSLLQLPIFPRLKWQYLLATIYTLTAFLATLLIIKYNTIIHPFTLADNRHYVFYVFRYTILRHPLIRYILAPIYLACGWAAYLTLCTAANPSTPHFDHKKSDKKPIKAPTSQKRLLLQRKETTKDAPKTSFLIIYLITTALSLITAPLVEPRYFIIPWVIWRLHVPSFPLSSSQPSPQPASSSGRSTWQSIKYLAYESHDYRLWLETFYFLAINAVTGYIFLYKGFKWEQEPGKVQRFMW